MFWEPSPQNAHIVYTASRISIGPFDKQSVENESVPHKEESL